MPTPTLTTSNIPYQSNNININTDNSNTLPIIRSSFPMPTSTQEPITTVDQYPVNKTHSSFPMPTSTQEPITTVDQYPATNIRTSFPISTSIQEPVTTVGEYQTTNIRTSFPVSTSMQEPITTVSEYPVTRTSFPMLNPPDIIPYKTESQRTSVNNPFDNILGSHDYSVNSHRNSIPPGCRTQTEIVPVEEIEYVPVKKKKLIRRTKVFVPTIKKVPIRKTIYVKRPRKIIVPVKSMTNISYQYPFDTNYNYESPRPGSPVPYSSLSEPYSGYEKKYEEQTITNNYNISQVQPPSSPLRMSNASNYNQPSSPLRTSFVYSGKLYSPRTYKPRSLINRRLIW